MVSNDAVASLFIASNMRAQHICSAGLPYFSLGYVFFTLNIVIIGFFQGTERPRQATLFMLLRGCIFLVPLYLRLPRIAGVHGLWLSVPASEFLTLLHGVIDSPDIPLNVSRSYLQSDANVKKISKYITKKVSDRLESIFKENRKDFEAKWDDLKLFINYGLLSDPDFYEKAKGYVLLKDVDGKYFTYDEYRNLIKDNQTDKEKTLVYLYATDRDEQYTYIHAAQEKGYSVLLMDGQLDPALISMLEQKLEKCRWSRVDGDIAERLIPKEDSNEGIQTVQRGKSQRDLRHRRRPRHGRDRPDFRL